MLKSQPAHDESDSSCPVDGVAEPSAVNEQASPNEQAADEPTAPMGRREWLRLGALAGTGALLSGCSNVIRRYTAPAAPAAVALPKGDIEPATRLLNRVAFGPAPGEVARVTKMGAARYVEEQLHPDDEESRMLMLRLRGIEALHPNPTDLQNLKEREVLSQLQQAAILRAVYSRHQLRERMVDFWSNHFNIYAHEGHRTFYKPADEVGVIRRHALGAFPELLRASAHSPAMLFYLNNEVNRRGVPNENYARELMELHTLGVHGGYTQKDVQEVARCLTGWTVEERFLRRRGTFRFDASRHDNGSKTVLGVRIPAGGGEKDAERVLDILAKHPQTARFIAGKISRYFLGDDAAKWTGKLAKIYLRTGGDIKAMLRPLLLSDELRRSSPMLKRPFDLMVSALRALNADTDGGPGVQSHLARMGQPLYQWPMPDGYPDKTAAWTGSLLARWNFALALCARGIPGTSIDLPGLLRSSPHDDHTAALREIVYARRATAGGRSAGSQALFKRAAFEMNAAALSRSGRAARESDSASRQSDSASRQSDSAARPSASALAETAALLLAAPEFQWR